jgi:hypothetical protein
MSGRVAAAARGVRTARHADARELANAKGSALPLAGFGFFDMAILPATDRGALSAVHLCLLLSWFIKQCSRPSVSDHGAADFFGIPTSRPTIPIFLGV